MEKSLLKIAQAFNERQITWAVGASMLLYYKGLVAAPKDIDIIVALKDNGTAETVLNTMGTKCPQNPDEHYSTQCFSEYVVDGVDIDVISGFIINHKSKAYEYQLAPAFFEKRLVDEITVYLCPMEDWYVLYALMPDRQEKVALIASYLKSVQCNTQAFSRWLDQPLPEAIAENIKAIIRDVT